MQQGPCAGRAMVVADQQQGMVAEALSRSTRDHGGDGGSTARYSTSVLVYAKAGKPAPPITLPENDEVQSEPVPAFDQPQPLAPREVTSPTPRKVEMAICHDDRDRPGRADRGGSRRHRTIWLQRIEGHAPRASPLKCPGVPGSAVLCVLLARWTPPGPGLVLLLCWPQRPRSAVAPALRTRPCHTGTRARPRLSTPAIFHPMRRPPEDRLPPATAGLPAIPLPPRPGRE